jgi:hypothetical protein
MYSRTPLIMVLALTFTAGFFTRVLYERWSLTRPQGTERVVSREPEQLSTVELPAFRVSYLPPPPTVAKTAALPAIVARDLEKIRSLTGQQVRVRGRVFHVGHSAKSNTYFVNFGPSRDALTAVIFSTAAELFEKQQQSPKQFENREVEIVGFVKDHPQYGLEIIIEHPEQIQVLGQ